MFSCSRSEVRHAAAVYWAGAGADVSVCQSANSARAVFLYISAYVENSLFCRRPGRTPTATAP
jgi:hypothetical protein